MKFGGSALADGKKIRKIAKIVKKYHRKNKILVVTSAMVGVTDKLFLIGAYLKQKKISEIAHLLDQIKLQHYTAVNLVTPLQRRILLKTELLKLFSHLENYIHNISKKEITPARIDFLVSFGERLSIRLVSEALIAEKLNAYPVDASNILATTHEFSNAVPLVRSKQKYLDEMLLPLLQNKVIPVITGYIGYSGDGCTTTLGRGGSDLTATYLADFLNVKAVYLWKDVEGFYSEDPKKNKKAVLFSELSYSKAKELALNGAKVIYYKAIDPVKKRKISIYIKSFIKPELKGTIIH